MKPRLWSAIVTVKLDVVIANVHTPERKDVITYALEALSEVGSDDIAQIEDGPREIGSIVDVPVSLEDAVPYGPVEDNPENLTVEEILSLPEPKPVEPLGEQVSLHIDEQVNLQKWFNKPDQKFTAVIEPIKGGQKITFTPVDEGKDDA